MRRFRPLIVVAVLSTLALGCAPDPDDAVGATCAVVRQHAATWQKAADEAWAQRSPGGVLAVEFPGANCRWVHTFGVAEADTNTPYTADLQQPIGSITKTMTGTVVLQLVDEGRLALDDTIDRWFPEVAEADAITVEMLLNMSSGIQEFLVADLEGLVASLVADPTTRRDRMDLIAMGTGLPRAFDPPGSQFAYSNTNTLMAAVIVEAVTGHAFEDEMRRRVLEPAGLDRSLLLLGAGMEPPFAHGTTSMVPGGADTSGWTLSYADAAGGVVSDIDDLLRWGRVLGEGSLLSAEMRTARVDRRSLMFEASDGFPLDAWYGLGTMLATDPGSDRVRMVLHAGEVAGYEATLVHFPVTGAVVAALANNDGAGVPDAVKDAVLASTPQLFLGE